MYARQPFGAIHGEDTLANLVQLLPELSLRRNGRRREPLELDATKGLCGFYFRDWCVVVSSV